MSITLTFCEPFLGPNLGILPPRRGLRRPFPRGVKRKLAIGRRRQPQMRHVADLRAQAAVLVQLGDVAMQHRIDVAYEKKKKGD